MEPPLLLFMLSMYKANKGVIVVVNTDTKGTSQNVRIIGVSVLSAFPTKSNRHTFCR